MSFWISAPVIWFIAWDIEIIVHQQQKKKWRKFFAEILLVFYVLCTFFARSSLFTFNTISSSSSTQDDVCSSLLHFISSSNDCSFEKHRRGMMNFQMSDLYLYLRLQSLFNFFLSLFPRYETENFIFSIFFWHFRYLSSCSLFALQRPKIDCRPCTSRVLSDERKFGVDISSSLRVARHSNPRGLML